MTFLIIDDSETDRLIARILLKSKFNQAEVTEVDNALKGLTWLKEKSINHKVYVLLDIRMPEMDGFEFLALYENLPRSIQEQTEIIMISSTLDPYDIKRAQEHDKVKKLLEKPLNPEQLSPLIYQ